MLANPGAAVGGFAYRVFADGTLIGYRGQGRRWARSEEEALEERVRRTVEEWRVRREAERREELETMMQVEEVVEVVEVEESDDDGCYDDEEPFFQSLDAVLAEAVARDEAAARSAGGP